MASTGPTQRMVLDALPTEPDRMSVDLLTRRLNQAHGLSLSQSAVRAAVERMANRGLVSVHQPFRGLGLPHTYAKHEHSP